MQERIDKAGLRLAARRRRAAAVLGARPDAGARREARRGLPRGDGRRRPRPDGRAARRASPSSPGEEFNLNSPPQLRAILYDKLGLSPGKKTPKGQLSTDASVLEKLRDAHPIVDALLSWRELDKLNSTYLEALPREVDPRDGRVHTTFNQTGAATGRLSSSDPEPAEHPDPHRARPPDPPGVHPGRRGPGPAGRRLLADRAAGPGAPVGGRGAAPGVRLGRRRPHGDRGTACSGCPRTRWTMRRGPGPRW